MRHCSVVFVVEQAMLSGLLFVVGPSYVSFILKKTSRLLFYMSIVLRVRRELVGGKKDPKRNKKHQFHFEIGSLVIF